MAVRPIDANELYRIEKLLDTDIVRQDKVALNLLEQVLYDIQHVPTLTPPNEWVSVEERLPKPQENPVIACDYTGVCLAWYSPTMGWQYRTGLSGVDITHWMPLPQPPKEASHD